VVAWLHRFHRRVPPVDRGSLAKVVVSERIFLVAVRCDSCIGSDPIDAAVETMMIGQRGVVVLVKDAALLFRLQRQEKQMPQFRCPAQFVRSLSQLGLLQVRSYENFSALVSM
jgi:hypothetical protein